MEGYTKIFGRGHVVIPTGALLKNELNGSVLGCEVMCGYTMNMGATSVYCTHNLVGHEKECPNCGAKIDWNEFYISNAEDAEHYRKFLNHPSDSDKDSATKILVELSAEDIIHIRYRLNQYIFENDNNKNIDRGYLSKLCDISNRLSRSLIEVRGNNGV